MLLRVNVEDHGALKRAVEACYSDVRKDIIDIVKDSRFELRKSVEEQAEKLIYRAYKPKFYKRNRNLIKAINTEYREWGSGSIDMIAFNDSNAVVVKRPKQEPIEEIPVTINTGVGYPDSPGGYPWGGPIHPRPYYQKGGEDYAKWLVGRIERYNQGVGPQYIHTVKGK